MFWILREKFPMLQFFSGPYFHAFGLNTEFCSVNLRFQAEYRNILARKKTANWDTFQAVVKLILSKFVCVQKEANMLLYATQFIKQEFDRLLLGSQRKSEWTSA